MRRLIFGLNLAVLLISIMLLLQGCKKLIEVEEPIDKYTTDDVFNSTSSAVSVVTGIYASFVKDLGSGEAGFSLNLGLLADDFGPIPLSRNFKGIDYTNNTNIEEGFHPWGSSYRKYIYRLNSALEGISKSKGIPEGSKKILLGETKFLRGLLYFYLVNLYGDVPLVLTTDFKVNSNIPRSPVDIVYDQIINDLTDAQSTLREEYLAADLESPTSERIRPNKAAATALLARVYLYREKWDLAENEATKVIDNTSYYDTVALKDVFLKNSREAIWQLQPNPIDQNGNTNTLDASTLYMPAFDEPFSLGHSLLDSFEMGDNRLSEWVKDFQQFGITYKIPYKYKVGVRAETDPPQEQTEYTMVLRLAELYLVRAEARIRSGNLSGGIMDLDLIRKRAGLPGTTESTESGLLNAIDHERQVELFTEWGHRWFDLKRRDKIDYVMSNVAPLKQAFGFICKWEPYKALLPIAKIELENNPSLKGHQNPGYPEQ